MEKTITERLRAIGIEPAPSDHPLFSQPPMIYATGSPLSSVLKPEDSGQSQSATKALESQGEQGEKSAGHAQD